MVKVKKMFQWMVTPRSVIALGFFWLVLCRSLYADEVTAFLNDDKVVTQLDASSIDENQPITGSVMITHNKNNVVDVNSFRMGKEPLAVEFVKDVQFDPNNPLILTIYSFRIPGKSPGLYALPAVSVKVGEKNYQSVMLSYSVQAKPNSAATDSPGTPSPTQSPPSPKASSPPSPQVSPPSSPVVKNPVSTEPSLRLEALVEGKNALYPGQRTTLTYRYYFSGHIELTDEKLPLLDAQGMTKIGEKEIKDSVQGNVSISQISQEVEAVKPGDFSYGPSEIAGYAYQEDASGKHVHTSPKLTSIAPPVTITVLPFPEKNQPTSFNGAVGAYEFNVTLKSAAEINVGDVITLVVAITGRGNVQNVPLPNIERQPGFSGFFRFNDLPPQEEVHDDTKTYILQLRPLTNEIKEIPSIEFSYFNPDTVDYTILHSQAIPIVVKTAKSQTTSAPAVGNVSKEAPQPAYSGDHSLQTSSYAPSLIEVEGIYVLDAADLYNRFGGTWWVFGLVPLGIGLVLYQRYVRTYLWQQQKQAKVLTSQSVLRQALQQPEGSPKYFEGINKALKMALVEKGYLSKDDIADEKLPTKGLCSEVRAFLCDIEEKRFAGREYAGRDILDYATVQAMAVALLEKIRQSHGQGGIA